MRGWKEREERKKRERKRERQRRTDLNILGVKPRPQVLHWTILGRGSAPEPHRPWRAFSVVIPTDRCLKSASGLA